MAPRVLYYGTMPLELQPTMLIAVGDYRHGDEAVSHRVLSLLGTRNGVVTYDAPEWSGDLAAKFAQAKEVVFVDADERLGEPSMEQVDGRSAAGQLVDSSRREHHFNGRAYLCRVPGLEFGRRASGLTAYAESRAILAAGLLRKFLGVTA